MGARHFLTRLKALFRGQELRDEIHDEFEFHIEQRTLENVRRGLSPDDARRSAERAFGRRTQLMEAAVDVRGGGAWLESITFDLRYAARRLWHQPGFTVPAVTILVFGIAANTVLFSVLSSALLSRPPVPAADEIVRVYSGRSVAFPTYLALADATRGDLALAAYAQRPLSIRFGAGYAERVVGELVSENYFEMLRVAPVEGRLWARQSSSPHAVPVVLSETFARRMSPTASLAGSDVWINGEPGIVVGIMPATFTGSNPGFQANAWVPIHSLPALRSRLTDRGDRWLNMIGRLASGVSTGRAQARLTATSADQRTAREDAFRVQPATGLAVAPDSRAAFLASLGALSAVMIVVLLVAAASVGGLLLARSMGARGETALRLALGASRARIAQQILCETLLLALLSGVVSVVVGMEVVPAVAALIPADYGLPMLEMQVTGAAALFTMAVACIAGVLFGLLPARRLWTADVRTYLWDLAGSTPKRGRTSTLLVAGQVAGSVMLLMTAGMFLHALYSATARMPAVAARVLVVPLALGENGYNDVRAAAFANDATARLLADPAVHTVSLAQFGLYSGSSNLRLVEPTSRAPFEVESNQVGPGYFRTIHLPVVAGREFVQDDSAAASPAVIVNAAFAQRLGMSPTETIGAPLRLGQSVVHIIGVVQNADNVRPGEGDRPFLYEPLAASGGADVALHVEAVSEGHALAPTVRNTLRRLDPNLPLYQMRTLEEQMQVGMAPSKAAAAITTALGIVALVLAGAGVYGITAFLIAARSREIGIRMALGADRAAILTLVSRDGVHITAVGIAVGLILALAATRLLGLYVGISINGIIPIASATAVVVCGAVALAGWAPLRRGLATDPVRALRAE